MPLPPLSENCKIILRQISAEAKTQQERLGQGLIVSTARLSLLTRRHVDGSNAPTAAEETSILEEIKVLMQVAQTDLNKRLKYQEIDQNITTLLNAESTPESHIKALEQLLRPGAERADSPERGLGLNAIQEDLREYNNLLKQQHGPKRQNLGRQPGNEGPRGR